MLEGALERYTERYKRERKTLQQELARMVVGLGYEPRYWNETEEIARDLVAEHKKRNEEQGNAQMAETSHKDS